MWHALSADQHAAANAHRELDNCVCGVIIAAEKMTHAYISAAREGIRPRARQRSSQAGGRGWATRWGRSHPGAYACGILPLHCSPVGAFDL